MANYWRVSDMGLFNYSFRTDDYDQEMIEFVRNLGDSNERRSNLHLTKYLKYGDCNNYFWTNATDPCNDYKLLTKEEFKKEIGMTTVKLKDGHKLADGTYSSEYKVGDKFVVIGDDYGGFSEGALVELTSEVGSMGNPLFKLLEGDCKYSNYHGKKGAYTYWKYVSAHKPATELQQLIDQSKQLLERIEELTKREEATKVNIDLVKHRIQTELDLAKAKRERLSAHIDILGRKLAE
jgi:hypothetical protein